MILSPEPFVHSHERALMHTFPPPVIFYYIPRHHIHSALRKICLRKSFVMGSTVASYTAFMMVLARCTGNGYANKGRTIRHCGVANKHNYQLIDAVCVNAQHPVCPNHMGVGLDSWDCPRGRLRTRLTNAKSPELLVWIRIPVVRCRSTIGMNCAPPEGNKCMCSSSLYPVTVVAAYSKSTASLQNFGC